LKTQTEEIGLAKARMYLENNIPFEAGKTGTNRPTSARLINGYALEMLKDRWQHTHQGIGFDVNGHLIDGQQRLMALVQACTEGAIDGDKNYPPNPKLRVKFQVTHGLNPGVFPYLDRGRARTADQILAMSGYANSAVLAATARLVYLFINFDQKVWKYVTITPEEIKEIVEKHELEKYMTIGYQVASVGMIKSSAMAGYFVCKNAYPDGPHEEFVRGVYTGADLAFDDPRLALRNYMIRSSNSSEKLRRISHEHLAMYIKAWNLFVDGKRRQVMTFRADEKMQRPVEKPA
jgi:hypothetical protein